MRQSQFASEPKWLALTVCEDTNRGDTALLGVLTNDSVVSVVFGYEMLTICGDTKRGDTALVCVLTNEPVVSVVLLFMLG